MDEKQFSMILSKLDSIIKLQAIAAVREKGLREQVAMLASLGFQPKQIADILGKTPNHISVILSELRKAEKVTSVESKLQKESEKTTGEVLDK